MHTLLKSSVLYEIHGLFCEFQTARHDEAWMILKRVHDTNWRAKGEPERVFQVKMSILND